MLRRSARDWIHGGRSACPAIPCRDGGAARSGLPPRCGSSSSSGRTVRHACGSSTNVSRRAASRAAAESRLDKAARTSARLLTASSSIQSRPAAQVKACRRARDRVSAATTRSGIRRYRWPPPSLRGLQGESQQDVPRRLLHYAVSGTHEQHSSRHRRSWRTDRASVSRHTVHGIERACGLE